MKKTERQPIDQLATPAEAGAVLGLTPQGVRALESRGVLVPAARTVSGRRLYRLSEVEALRKEREANPPRPGPKFR
jgi:DNA-binding transcriptional MerR regulator